MNLLQKLIIGVRFVGFKATFRTVLYSFYRDRINRRFGVASQEATAQESSPEILEGMNPFHNGAVFSFNNGFKLEVAFLSMHSVRITWQPGDLPLNYAVTGEETIALRVERTEKNEGWHFTAGSLEVLVKWDGRVTYISDGVVVREDAPPVYEAPAWQHSAGPLADSAIYGMGERAKWNLRRGEYSLWNADVGGSYGTETDPLYLTMPLYYCLQRKGSYLVFYDNSYDGSASFKNDAVFRFTGGALRVYFIEGKPEEAMEEFSRIVGRAPLPPQWALGFHQCRWGYRSAEEVYRVVEGFKKHALPLDVFHLDIDYMDGYRVFTNDPENFPDLERLTSVLERDGVKTVVILDPGVKVDPDYGVYRTGLEQDVFCKLPNGEIMRGLVWPGWVHFPDFTNPVVRQWWGEYYQRLVEDGIAGFWHDMNEPSVFSAYGEGTFPRVTAHHMEGRGGSHEEAHNIYGLEMCAAGHRAVRNYAPDKRPWFLTRSGWTGVQRYAWKWTGDVESSWPALKMTIATVLSLGISGVPFSGSDIGGFSGNPDAELYTRWFQMSAFMAFFRNHAAISTKPREPWVYGEPTTSILREMLLLRKRFLPYIYTLTWEASQNGAPLVRPLFWEIPENKRLWDIEDAFLLGNSVLVAPVVAQGANTRTVYLPSGDWYHFWDDKVHAGSHEVTVDAPIERIPLFVKAGNVLPMMDDGVLTLHVYLPEEDVNNVASQHYTDDGDGYGDFRLDTFSITREGKIGHLKWLWEGEYPLPDEVAVAVHGAKPTHYTLEDVLYDWEVEVIKIKPFKNLRFELE